ncbi:MAG: hypothetical protein O2816_05670 [Planctomycetota bacterium]|nr:hypothetical protein [Planctomycetota bacterium]
MSNPNVDAEIRACVDSFVNDLTNIVRRSSLEQVLEAVSSAMGSPVRTKRGPGRPRKTGAAPSKPGKRLRRSSAKVDQMTENALAHITANAGCSVGELGSALGASTKDLRLPLQKLLADGKVRTVGQKRGTRYHPGGRRPGAKKASKKKSGRKKA